ncbi:MAG TPA: S53 family peptidase [Actinomycetota bacterium]
MGVAAIALGAATLAATGASASPARTTLAGSRPSWATSSNQVGSANAGASISVRVYLSPKGGEAALAAAVKAVSTPGSSSFRHFITPAQYQATYGPTAAQIARVKAWLKGAGMRVTGMGAANRYVAATGTVGAAASAFGVTFGTYRLNGQTVRAPEADASVPGSVGADVLGIVGLDNAPHMVKPALAPPAGFANARPCSRYYGQVAAKYEADFTTRLPGFDGKIRKYAVCGYTPPQFRGAYGVDDSGFTGQGATVAITDSYAAPTIGGDAARYAQLVGDPVFGPGQFTTSPPDGAFRFFGKCGGNGWYGEETLDVEAVHAMALNANVIYYPSRSCFDVDFLDTFSRIVDENKASIVTNSWGDVESAESAGAIAAYDQLFQQGALQGIGFFFSSGDDGDELLASGTLQADYPASDPNVTAVGGTSTAIGNGNHLRMETGWGTYKYSLSSDGRSWDPIADPPFLYGAGGGYSALFNRPDYQDGVVPSDTPPYRAVPDIALDADPTTGMLVGETQTWPDGVHYGTYRIGGTSLSSPLMAGMEALATEAAGTRIGFANPAIYSLFGSDAVNDVLSVKDANVRPDFVNGVDPSDGIVYSVRTFDQDSSLFTAPGWDDVTGIGSPNSNYPSALAGS